MEQDTTRLELKIQALREGFRTRVANLSDDYENQIADLRIELTNVTQLCQNLSTELAQARQEAEERDFDTREEDPTDDAN